MDVNEKDPFTPKALDKKAPEDQRACCDPATMQGCCDPATKAECCADGGCRCGCGC